MRAQISIKSKACEAVGRARWVEAEQSTLVGELVLWKENSGQT